MPFFRSQIHVLSCFCTHTNARFPNIGLVLNITHFVSCLINKKVVCLRKLKLSTLVWNCHFLSLFLRLINIWSNWETFQNLLQRITKRSLYELLPKNDLQLGSIWKLHGFLRRHAIEFTQKKKEDVKIQIIASRKNIRYFSILNPSSQILIHFQLFI